MKTAIVIGATGLIGSHLTGQLLDNNHYRSIKVFTRRPVNLDDSKLESHIVDFENIESWQQLITGDELFSALGTTLKKAGGKEAQYKVDFTYQYNVAKAAAGNGVRKYLLVSSAGANAASNNFYLRMKGELDQKVSALPFQQVIIFKPSILAGKRGESRVLEEIGVSILNPVIRLLPFFKKYRPIEGEIVAAAMIKAAGIESEEIVVEYVLDEIFDLVQ
jgi:uncharacterized protein YbjT (DUF2867 family)